MYKQEDLLRIQSIEKEMLLAIDEVCKKLNICYFSVGGTTLGAVRHNGFIPWDDDIDIGMLRDDYDIFIEKAPDIIDKKYSVQNFVFNKHIPFYHTKVMKNNTKFVEKGIEHLKIQKGIFVDIMPYDYLPEDFQTRNKVIKRQKFYSTLFGIKSQIRTFRRNKFKNILYTIIRFLLWLLLLPIPKKYFFKKYDASLKKINSSSMLGSRGYKEFVIQANDLFPLASHAFDELTIPIPNNYDAVLRTQYGEYMVLPPLEKRFQHEPLLLDFGDEDAEK